MLLMLIRGDHHGVPPIDDLETEARTESGERRQTLIANSPMG